MKKGFGRGMPGWVLPVVFLLIAGACTRSCDRENLERIRDEAREREQSEVFFSDSVRIEPVYQIHFIDVGQGDATLVLTPEKAVLIDGGDKPQLLAAYLWSLHVNHIDILVVTHPHADHLGGIPYILENFSVGEILDPGVVHTTRLYERYLNLVDEKNIPFSLARKGVVRDLGSGAGMEVLHPVNPDDRNLNNASIVLKVKLGRIGVLLTGDIERKSEEMLMQNRMALRSEILRVAHHGSNTSSHMAFLMSVRPKISIVSVGQNNKYGLPDPMVMERLEKLPSEVYRTDIHGHIVIVTDGREYAVQTSSGHKSAAVYTGEADSDPDTERPGTAEPLMVDLNTASYEQLLSIVHIGPERARQIVALRPLGSLDDLLKVEGIGPSRLDDIRIQNIAIVKSP